MARLPRAIVVLAYLAGVAWRWHHINIHDPRKNVYSDMQLYMGIAKRLATDGYQLRPFDVMWPPGTGVLYSKFLIADPSLDSLVMLQFAVSALIPLAVGALAWAAFDRVTAGWAVIVSSGSYYYMEYASFFLSEIYMMLLVPLTMALYLSAARSTHPLRAILVGTVAGTTFFVTLAFKMVSLSAILGFCIVHWLFTQGTSRKIKTIALITLCVAAAPGIAAMTLRCTEGNHGKPCFVSSKGAADFLLGHYGRIHSLKWSDATFGSPAAQQHGYSEKPKVSFSIQDNDQNSDTAWDWVRSNKLPAVVLSVQHVFDMLGPNAPWPVIWTSEWAVAQGYQYFFVLFLLCPSFMLCFHLARSYGLMGLLRSNEFALFSTIFGISVAVFIATGEARYRLPFDCVFIVLGIRFYIHLSARYQPQRFLAWLIGAAPGGAPDSAALGRAASGAGASERPPAPPEKSAAECGAETSESQATHQIA